MVKGGVKKAKKKTKKPRQTDFDGSIRTVQEDQEHADKAHKIGKFKNTQVRSKMFGDIKKKKKRAKDEARKLRKNEIVKAKELGLEPPKKLIPKTIENQRVIDEKDIPNTSLTADEVQDELQDHFKLHRPPKVLVTTCYKPTPVTFKFLAEMMEVLPSAEFYTRRGFPLKKIVEFATNRDFTAVLVFNEDAKKLNGLLVIGLPHGPTAHFRIRHVVLGEDIPGHARATNHKPEVILNNFQTKLGHRIGRLMCSLFTQDPTFKGRRAVTFHNQRDFIFFRHHRYIFEENERQMKGQGKKNVVQARLQEVGPRFTLRLLSLQTGTFDSIGGKYEWKYCKAQGMGKKNFHL